MLVEFFCDAAPSKWLKLQRMLALVRYKLERGDTRRIGGDIITNTAKFFYPECEGNNDHRLLYTRALAVVDPSLAPFLSMEGDAKANVLLHCGWQSPPCIGWAEIEAANL